METTKNKMTPTERAFFDRIGAGLDTPLYFYGSIQRPDYFRKHSDIDVDIFSFHEQAMIHKLAAILNTDISKFKRIISRPPMTNSVIVGYKYSYKDENLSVEFSIYNEKYKEHVLKEHRRKFKLPFYLLFPLIILKFIYYRLQILPKNIFIKCKRFLVNFIDDSEQAFVFLDT